MNSIQSFGRSIGHTLKILDGFPSYRKNCQRLDHCQYSPVQFKAESERALHFQLVSFVGDEAEKVNAAVFRAAAGPVRDALLK
jgi:hypothetical protein